jgi:parvulin-like peptidyl-prolyl isomerase
MITTKRIALAIGAVALLAAGCSSADVAATVNDSEIAESSVLALRVSREDASSVSGEVFRNDLSRLIFTEALITEAESDFGLTGLDSEETGNAFMASAGPQEQQYLTSVADDPTFTEEAVDMAVTQLVLRSEVRKALTNDPAVLGDIFQDFGGELIEVCARHILVASEGEAFDVLLALEAGEDFADLADDISLDETSVGGALPCPVSPSAFVGPFAAAVTTAPIGEATGPVQSEFGWHIVLVELRESPASLEELTENPARWIPAETIDHLWNTWINDAVDKAVIVVRSDIGTWVPEVDGILPPPQSP